MRAESPGGLTFSHFAPAMLTVFSQPTRGFGQRAPHLVSADFTLNFDPLYLNQYGSN
jgi:hypothetical protein